jgi:hypothetical protein
MKRFVFPALLFISLANTVAAETSRGEAIECFNTAFAEVENGDYGKLLAETVSRIDLISLSIKFANVNARRYDQLTSTDLGRFEAIVQDFLEGVLPSSLPTIKFEDIIMSTVAISPLHGKTIGNSYSLAGTFLTTDQSGHSFRMRWVYTGDVCYLVDGGWNGILFSFAIGKTF